MVYKFCSCLYNCLGEHATNTTEKPHLEMDLDESFINNDNADMEIFTKFVGLAIIHYAETRTTGWRSPIWLCLS